MKKTNWVREDTKRVQRAADRGNAHAAYELAMRLLTARKADLNLKAGYDWARYAAGRGLMKAQELTGLCLVHGLGTAPDGEAAVEWFQKAACQGSAVAYFNLGCCYLVGIALPRSRRAARLYFQKAAERGYSRAAAAIGALDASEPRGARAAEARILAAAAPRAGEQPQRAA